MSRIHRLNLLDIASPKARNTGSSRMVAMMQSTKTKMLSGETPSFIRSSRRPRKMVIMTENAAKPMSICFIILPSILSSIQDISS